jgi:hypothetical protein
MAVTGRGASPLKSPWLVDPATGSSAFTPLYYGAFKAPLNDWAFEAGGSSGTATGSASFSFGVSGVGAATAASAGSASFSFSVAGVGTGITASVGNAAFAFAPAGVGAAIIASVGTVSFAFDVSGVGGTAGGVVSAVGEAAFAFAVSGVGDGLGGVSGGGGPRQRIKPILYVGPRPIEEAVRDTREAVAALAEDAADVENRRKRKRISAAIEALHIEILELENAATAAEARILIGMIERETARVAQLIEAAQAVQDDEEEVELLLLA